MKYFAIAQWQWPGAKIIASTFDAWWADFSVVTPQLPVEGREMGETWVTGYAVRAYVRVFPYSCAVPPCVMHPPPLHCAPHSLRFTSGHCCYDALLCVRACVSAKRHNDDNSPPLVSVLLCLNPRVSAVRPHEDGRVPRRLSRVRGVREVGGLQSHRHAHP